MPIGAAVPAGPDSVRGRGLQMVAGLSAGMWGHHLSRGRLGVWKVPGKAVWFALRIPATSELARSERLAPRGSEAIEELAAALTDRGLGTGLVPVTEPGGDLAVLSVSHKLTVWCQGQAIWWREPDGSYDRLCRSLTWSRRPSGSWPRTRNLLTARKGAAVKAGESQSADPADDGRCHARQAPGPGRPPE